MTKKKLSGIDSKGASYQQKSPKSLRGFTHRTTESSLYLFKYLCTFEAHLGVCSKAQWQ